MGTTEGESAAQKGRGTGDLRTLGEESVLEHKRSSQFESASLKTESEREFLFFSSAVAIKCHLRDPLAVFRHTQSLAAKQGDMERGKRERKWGGREGEGEGEQEREGGREGGRESGLVSRCCLFSLHPTPYHRCTVRVKKLFTLSSVVFSFSVPFQLALRFFSRA